MERRFGAHSPFPWPRPEVASASSRPKLEKKKNASLRRCIIFGLELWPCERRGTTTVGAPATTAPPDRPRATRAIGLRSRRALTHLAASCLKLLRLLSTSAVAQRSKLVPLVPPNGRSAREFQDPHSRGRRGGREERGVGGGVGGGRRHPSCAATRPREVLRVLPPRVPQREAQGRQGTDVHRFYGQPETQDTPA